MAEDIKLVIETDNPTVVVTTADKVDIKNAAKSSDINFIATGSSGIKGDTGPQGPAGTGLTTEQAAAIDTNTAKNSFDNASVNKLNNIEANAQVNRALLDEDNMVSDSNTLAPTQQSVKAYVDGQTHLELGTTNTTALAGNTTTISTEQASAITANTAKPDLTVDGAGTVHSNNYTDTVYTHPTSHPISLITGLQTALNSKQDSIGNEDLTIQQTDGLQDALDAKVDDSQVLTNVPANAVFTDTVYTHPANHAISVITGLQSALDAKQGAIGDEDLTIAMTDGLQDALNAKVDDSQVLTNVPANAVFTDTNTTYSVQDGELSQNNFTDADHTKLNGIEANATADQTNVTGSSGSCTGNAATATALTAGDKTINGDLTVSSGTSGEATLTIISDTDNDDENDNPFLVFTQDGGAINGYMGLTGDADKWPDGGTLTGATANALVLGTKGPTTSTHSQLFLTAGDAIRLTILNDGKVGIGTTTPSQSLEVSGNIDLTGIVRPGLTYIKILPSDFIPDDVGRPAQIDDTGSDRWLKSHSTAKLYVSVEIPLGFKATHVDVYGSGTSAVTVYEADIDSKTVTSKGTGNIGTQIDITDVTADATNYLLIELAQTSSEEVYGGKVTIAKV